MGEGGSGKAQRWTQEEAVVVVITRSVVHGQALPGAQHNITLAAWTLDSASRPPGRRLRRAIGGCGGFAEGERALLALDDKRAGQDRTGRRSNFRTAGLPDPHQARCTGSTTAR